MNPPAKNNHSDHQRRDSHPKPKITGLKSLQKSQAKTRLAMLNVMEDLKEAKNAIEIAKTKDEAILSSIADAVLACDNQGTIILFNKAAEKLTGVTSHQACNHHYQKVISIIKESDGKPGNDFIAEAINTNKVTKMSNHALLVRQDGLKIPVSESAAPIIDASGQTIGCVAIFHDVTREHEIDRVKSEFVSLASHQLRTPLTTINWSSEKLISDGKLDPNQQSQVNEIHDASKRMVGLVDSLLNVSRLEMGTISIEPKLVDIVHVSKACLQELKPKIAQKNLTFTGKYSLHLNSIKTDPKLLNIILLNLLSNSIKYTPPKGKISLTIKKEKEDIVITLTDTGIGIPLKQQHLVFSKLFRADNAQVADPNGTGLGLYIVQAVTQSLGGDISFESIEKKGTTFTVVLPLSGITKVIGTKQLIHKDI